jgi:hypothetical protein
MAYVGTPIDVGNQFSSLVGKRFSGDASTTAFTLDVRANSALDIEVFVENVRQDPNSAYTVDGTTLTFTAAPPSGTNNIYVVHQAPTVASVSPTAGSVTASSFDNSVISGHTALATAPATTDEFLISDGGTIKRIDYSVLGATPAFEANLGSDQTVSDNTFTKLNINTEVFDTDSKYDASTNYRFTPTVAGKYFVYGSVHGETDASQMQLQQAAIYKNGSAYATNIIDFRNNNGLQANVFVAVTMDLDADDYVELYGKIYKGGGSTIKFLSGTTNTFGAYRLIGV